MRRLARAGLFLAACLALAPAAWAGGMTIEDFYGHYTGTGIASSAKAVTLDLVERDFDVTIEPDGDGFSVAWTTVVRQDGGAAEKPEVKRSSAKVAFVPTGRPNVFLAPAHADPMSESGYCWASLEGDTLTVYILAVDPESGQYNLHSYGRRLASRDDMELKFSRIGSGRPRVIVEGTLKRD